MIVTVVFFHPSEYCQPLPVLTLTVAVLLLESDLDDDAAETGIASIDMVIISTMRMLKEPLIKSFHDTLSNGFSSVGNDGFAFNQRFLKSFFQFTDLVLVILFSSFNSWLS